MEITEFMLRSSGLWLHIVLWQDTSVSEVHAASIFRAKLENALGLVPGLVLWNRQLFPVSPQSPLNQAAELTRLTHKIAIQLHIVQFSLQAASPETFEYTLIYLQSPLRLNGVVLY
jgi:hypothetical protein